MAKFSTHFAIAADPNCGQQCSQQGEDPAYCHDDAGVSQAKFAVKSQSMRDGVPALHGDRG